MALHTLKAASAGVNVTKATPRRKLTVVDKPLIQRSVQETTAAGITESFLVTHSSENSIKNHFDIRSELTLEKCVKYLCA